ncbi:lipoprotein [Kutzneria sp. 744]|nr:lipoprotein [Kutzneria sp. 744]
MEFRRCGKIAAGVTLVAMLSACQSPGLAVTPTTTATASTSASAIPTDLVGKSVPAAKEELAKLGFLRVDVESVDGRMVIVQSNWQVVSVDSGGGKVTLHVTKPTPTPTPVPTTTTQAAPPPPRTTEQAPPPPPQTTEEAAPPPVYYANCTDAKRAGAAPLYRGQPGYREALDRDHDGIACEK